ncbi:MAG: FAD-dependent oxidoreductase [Gammaproteobacteria bacterium]|nr:FAD-dependent oxidoreductase [Gammaproteobacteria bacterium]
MSDRFHPISMRQLSRWVFSELAEDDNIFGFPRSAFFVPSPEDRFRTSKYGYTMDNPFGVAAGPHTQMAQNIVVAWLNGARFIELKTVQTLDELDVPKPCIDCQDEGYNVEWSQELKIHESFDEYLRAWVLIHALHRKLGFPGDGPGMIFNMSVGYDYAGIRRPNVQWYLDQMNDASGHLDDYVDIVAEDYREVRDIDIPARLSDTITLSTMHGCPPDEIEKISKYLMKERSLHTSVKANPTLLGPERLREILHDDLGYVEVAVPDEAFGHDLRYEDAVPMFRRLFHVARSAGVTFGVKLSNTLEVLNFKEVFEEATMYMSGRALHAITVNVANELNEEFKGGLLISFAGGADAFNIPALLRSGMKSVTVCSDLLKSGGYMRMLQYFETTNAAMDVVGAMDLGDFIARSAIREPGFGDFASILSTASFGDTGLNPDRDECEALADFLSAGFEGSAPVAIRDWWMRRGLTETEAGAFSDEVVKALARVNLRSYADQVRQAWELKKSSFFRERSKTTRLLGSFDCIEAPCEDECPVRQRVPEYMRAVQEGDWARAVEVTREDNPIPTILGQVCDHLCEHTCVRTHYDEPLAIRDIKRFIMKQETDPKLVPQAPPNGVRVAIIGAGPAGISAAERLAMRGFSVTIFEQHPYPGGMVAGAIPEYRLPKHEIDHDIEVLDKLGVEVRYGQIAGKDFTISDLRGQGYTYIIVSVGAQIGKRLGLEGEDAAGVVDALHFLREAREGHPMPVGKRVAVIGAGDTAMDCARTAWRLGADEVAVVYRRTMDQMPADREEVDALLEEGIGVEELASPVGLHIEDGAVAGLVCVCNEYRGDRDGSGRKIPHPIEGSEFELPFDMVILAISQHALIDFFGEEAPRLTDRGYLEVDPLTLETSAEGVFAAGDVAGSGPASIVKAAADGKAVAAAIIAREGGVPEPVLRELPDVDVADILVRKAHRQYRVPITHVPVADRKNFAVSTFAYTVEEARAEAARCLDCDLYCSICVGVCPNMALMTYASEPMAVDLPVVTINDGAAQVTGHAPFRVEQDYQIAVLTDFCNECGNCVTFCPTAGDPYRDKPRLYLHRDDFLAETDNAFLLSESDGAPSMQGRFSGETHEIGLNGSLTYRWPGGSARLDPDTCAVLDVTAAEGSVLRFEAAATMYAILRGLQGSMPQLLRTEGDDRGRIPPPQFAS